jgi:type II secretory ATPase GspE/PulE/Tfp pilus assembly ATPase PilB-like protein
MKLEDPVEYPMEMIRQTSVNDAVRLDFADGIRSLMRQDPDVILVGEIRDEETATMAFRAAMTGHQVFSTLHTNSAIGAIARLLDNGIHAGIMSGNIVGVIAQRLVRKLCVHCKQVYDPSKLERQLLRLGVGSEAPPVYKSKGCRQCDHTGYKGRMSLMELLRFDREIDDLVARQATTREIHKVAMTKGFTTLADDGIRRVLEGVTSMDEVARVLDLTEGIA